MFLNLKPFVAVYCSRQHQAISIGCVYELLMHKTRRKSFLYGDPLNFFNLPFWTET